MKAGTAGAKPDKTQDPGPEVDKNLRRQESCR